MFIIIERFKMINVDKFNSNVFTFYLPSNVILQFALKSNLDMCLAIYIVHLP